MDPKLENYVLTNLEKLDDLDTDERVEQTSLMESVFSTLSRFSPGVTPQGQALVQSGEEINKTPAGPEIGRAMVSGTVKGVESTLNTAKDLMSVGGYVVNPVAHSILQQAYQNEYGMPFDNVDVVDMIMPILGLTSNDFDIALKSVEPETELGQVGRDLTMYIVAASIIPGGSGSNLVKGLIKGTGADMSVTPEIGNIATLAQELGVENEWVAFLNAKLEDPDDVSAFERLKAGLKGVATDTIGAGGVIYASFLAAAKIIGNTVGKAAIGSIGLTAATTEESEAGIPGLLSKYGFRTLGKNKQIVGAPPGMNTVKKLRNLETKLTDLAREGEVGRYWYEESSKTILDAVGGDINEADKLIQAIAITSPQTPVAGNFNFALQAYNQWKAGMPIKTGMFPTAMGPRLEKVFSGEDWGGRKTNDFYNNLMIHIDPSRVGPVTGDLWMLRAFGFTNPNEMPSEKQYEFITKVTQQIADDLGWKPHQVQASIWVNMKARSENKGVKELTEKISTKKGYMKYDENGKRVVINPQKHMETWLKTAYKYSPTEADLEKAGFNYADALKGNLGQISWESIPGRTSNHFPEMFDAPYEQQAEYHVAISKAFLDDDGNDIIAKKLGVLTPGDFEAPGYFEGKVSPGTQTEVAIPRMYKGPAYGKVEPAALDLINAYATVRGVLMKQDGVGWHRPFFNPAKKDANGIELRVGRELSEEEIDKFAVILKELSGHGEYNPISSPEGIRILNIDALRKNEDGTPVMEDTWIDKNLLKTNKEFAIAVKDAISKSDLDAEVIYFNSQNGYAMNDWSVNKNGEGYLREMGGEGRSDVYGKVYDLIQEIQARIDEVDEDFSARYGWTKNPDINSQFRRIAENTENMTIQ